MLNTIGFAPLVIWFIHKLGLNLNKTIDTSTFISKMYAIYTKVYSNK